MKPATFYKVIDTISALFILLFVYTATSKLLSYQSSLNNLKSSPLIGFAASFLGWGIPLVELSISALLLLPRFRKTGLVFSFALLTLFTAYIAYMLLTSSHLPCSCGGIINTLSWRQHLWLNVFLALLAATAIYLNHRLKFLLQ